MSQQNIDNEPLEVLARKIEQCVDASDEKVLEAAKYLREARERINKGEEGKIKWHEWARAHIDLSGSRLRELQQISQAEDPRAKLKELREKNAERQARHRDKKKSAPLRNGADSNSAANENLEPDRNALIAWATEAPLEQVARVLNYIKEIAAGENVDDTNVIAHLAAG